MRHIVSHLIWSYNENNYEEILHEIILFVGYFTVLNQKNQVKIELGMKPTIIQQLCNLSFNYFSDKSLMDILYPTLICCCYSNEKNRTVLTKELSGDMLRNYIEEKLNNSNCETKSSFICLLYTSRRG